MVQEHFFVHIVTEFLHTCLEFVVKQNLLFCIGISCFLDPTTWIPKQCAERHFMRDE